MITWILIMLGITLTASRASITWDIRKWMLRKSTFRGELVHCPMCVSFWVGMSLSFFSSPTGFVMLDGFFAVGVTWIVYSIIWFLALKDEDF